MNKRLTRRDFLLLSFTAVVGSVISSCAPSAPAQPTEAPAAATEAPAAATEAPAATEVPTAAAATPAQEKANILFWDQFGEEATALDDMVGVFNNAHPNIVVKRESQPNMRDILKTALSAGTGPDIMYYDTGPGFAGVLATADLLLPMDDAYAQYGWNDRFFGWTKSRCTFGGKVYGIGNELEFLGAFYNKKIFQDQGWSEPTSHDEMLALCEKAKAAKLVPIAFADQDKWPAYHEFSIFSSNIAGRDKLAQAISGKVPWNDDDFVSAIQMFFVDMNKAGYFIPDVNAVTYDDANMMFYSGKAAMDITGTWMVGNYTDPNTMADPVGFFFYPSIGGKTVAPPAGLGSGYFVSKATQHAEDCFQFLDYLMGKEAAKDWLEKLAKIPPIKGLKSSDYNLSDLMKFCLDALQGGGENMSYNIDVLTPDNFNTAMGDGFQEVLAGSKTAKQQADDLEKAMEEAKAAGKVMDITS